MNTTTSENNDRPLNSRHALVCGASAGIGRAAALALAGLGAEVTALARSRDALETLMPELEQAGSPRARFLVADHDDRKHLKTAVEGLIQREGPVQVLVNNSGGPPPGPILEAREEDFLAAFGRHLLANHLLVGLTLDGMRTSGYGRIVNIISVSVREPLPGLGVSNTIRGAVASWSKTLSRELPPPDHDQQPAARLHRHRTPDVAAGQDGGSGRSEETIQERWESTIPEGRIGRPEKLGAAPKFRDPSAMLKSLWHVAPQTPARRGWAESTRNVELMLQAPGHPTAFPAPL